MIDNTLLDKLLLLESKLRSIHEYKILEPFRFDPGDASAVQSAAKKIARHLNLEGLTFIISYARQGENVGGHIQLDSSSNVFIEIDGALKNSYRTVLYVLAHEICHKYLHRHNIWLTPELENELLTDTATIFTGLGKLTLNGCKQTQVYRERHYDGSRTKMTSTRRLGYMSKSQFALIYRVCSAIHRVSYLKMLLNLSIDSISEVRKVAREEKLYLSNRLFNRNHYSGRFKEQFMESQTDMAVFHRNIRTMQGVILPYCQDLYRKYNNLVFSKYRSVQNRLAGMDDKPWHIYLSNLMISGEYRSLRRDIRKFDSEHRKLIRAVERFNDFVTAQQKTLFRSGTDDFLHEFECPCCGKSMRIGAKKLARINCSECNHSFIVDTGHQKKKKGPVEYMRRNVVSRARSVMDRWV